MKTYDHLVALVDQPNADFDAFWADMKKRIPALANERDEIGLRVAGFKRAIKTAYLAGSTDVVAQITALE